MSVSRPGQEPQRLLPATVEHSLNDLAIRVVGGALVTFAATSWLALLSWQLRDPAGKAARNFLGATGHNLADMMVQTIGLAAVFALICPMIWGLELLSNVRWIPRLRLKMVAAIGGVLALSGAFSGMPAPPGWPLLGGCGGMVGDLLFNILSGAVLRNSTEKLSLVAVLILLAVGLSLLTYALGIKVRSLAALIVRRQPAPAAAPATAPAEPVAPSQAPQPVPVQDVQPVQSYAPVAHDPEDEADDKARAFAERFAPAISKGKPGKASRVLPDIVSPMTRAPMERWRRPSINLLRRPAAPAKPRLDVEDGARMLMEVLEAFGVKGQIREARPGPVVTRYELEPVRGTKIARVIGLADDFARELGVASVRVSVSSGRTTIGIEVPNDTRESVLLRDIIESDTYASSPVQLPLAIGKGIAGESVVLDLARMPHLLVAGTTGSGKSVGLNAMIVSLLYRLDPTELRLLLIDPKMLEMSQYERIPHLLHPVITDPAEAAQALEWAVTEMDERYRRMAQQSVRNIEAFNAKINTARTTGVALTRTVQTGFDPATGRAIYERQQLDDAPMPYIVIVIDELADLMVTAGKRVEGSVQRLAQKARAAGIHLVMATQRPSVDVITGTIKANLPMRMSFRVASKIDSRTIINEAGAEQLLGQGDMLLTSGSGQHLRVHGAYVADDEIERITEALREQGEPEYVEVLARATGRMPAASVVASADAARAAAADRRAEELYANAVGFVIGDRKASAGHLHRRMGVPESVAAELIARMEREGVISGPNAFGQRKILMKPEQTGTHQRRSIA